VVLREVPIVWVLSRKRLFAFVVGVLAEAEGWVGDAGSKGVHQPRSTVAVACACVDRASTPVGSHRRSRRRSIGHPRRRMLSMRVLRWTRSSLAKGTVHLNLHVQACVCTRRSSHTSPDSSKMSSWPKDKSSLESLVVYALMERFLV